MKCVKCGRTVGADGFCTSCGFDNKHVAKACNTANYYYNIGLEKLESGTESLEESMKLFEEGTALSARCYEKLRKAEQKIREIAPEEEENDE